MQITLWCYEIHYTYMHGSGKPVQKVAAAIKYNPDLHLLLKQAGNKMFYAEYRGWGCLLNTDSEVVMALMKDKSCILKDVF